MEGGERREERGVRSEERGERILKAWIELLSLTSESRVFIWQKKKAGNTPRLFFLIQRQ